MILGYSDLHFSPGGTMTNMGYSSRLLELMETCSWICDQILRLRPKLVVNLGDNSQNNNYVDLAALDAMGRSIWKIDMACKTVGAEHVILVGNHDMRDAVGSISVGSIFPYAQVVEGTLFKVLGLPPYGINLGFISYKRNLADFEAAIKQLSANKPDMLFIHQDVTGVLVNPVHISTDGVDVDGLNVRRVFNGHYHMPQTYIYGTPKNPRTTLYLVGSTVYHDFSDDADGSFGNERGLVWITKEDVERIPNPVTPVYHTMSLASTAEVGDWVFKDPCVEKYGKRMRLRVIGTEEQILSCKRYGILEQSCEWVRYVLRSRTAKQTDSNKDVDFNLLPDDMVRSYVKDADTTLNREHLTEFGINLLHGTI